MMTSTKNDGICLLCEQDVEHRLIAKHLNKCLKPSIQNNSSEKEKVFLFKVWDRSPNGKLFWLYIEINGSSKLEKFDTFLRDTWLECCDHMSQFNINDQYYANDGEMNQRVQHLFNIGMKFNYEYDLGSTTWLEGKVISVRPGKIPDGVRLLARNNLPNFVQCSICEKLPTVICSACLVYFCNKCKKKHKNCEDEDYLLPVVNSPRMGVCGYCGPEND